MQELITAIQRYIAENPETASKREAMRRFKIGTETLNRLEREGNFMFSKKRNKHNWMKSAPLSGRR